MQMLQNQDRELQIRLAQVQVDVQICLTLGFGCFAVLAALVTGLFRTVFGLPSEQVLLKTILSVLGLIVGFGCLYVTAHFAKKATAARKKIDDLKKNVYGRKSLFCALAR